MDAIFILVSPPQTGRRTVARYRFGPLRGLFYLGLKAVLHENQIMPKPARCLQTGRLCCYVLGRNVPFGTVKTGQTFVLERGRASELVARVDARAAFTLYRLGFGMFAKETVSVRRAWFGRIAERGTYAALALRAAR